MLYALAALGGLIVGAAGTFGGFWLYDLHDRANYNSAPKEPVHKETCPCGHVRSMHANGTGKCQSWPRGYPMGQSDNVKCPCQLYDGPGPLITDRTTIVVPNPQDNQRV